MNYDYTIGLGEPPVVRMSVRDDSIQMRAAEIPVRVPQIAKTTEILKGDNDGNAVAAEAGVDYQAPLEAGVDYQTPLVAGTDYQTPLPAQTGNSGKYLKTNGSAMSWESVPTPPVTSVNNKTGAVSLDAADVGALPDSIDVDEVKQNHPDPSNYSYWRPLVVGKSSNQSETGAFADQTGELYAFDAIRVQPSTGTVKATTFKGDVTGTASGNYVLPANGIPASDLEDKYAASHSAGGAAELTVAIPYGEVDSTSVNTAFTATVPGIHELKNGVCCYIRNDIVSGTTGLTLNVNGLGAKPVYASNADATRTTSGWTAAITMLLVYNENRVSGGCWDGYYGMPNANSIGYQVRTNSATLKVKTYCGRYRLLFKSPDGEYFVPANADSQTSASKTHTVTSEKIDPFGDIRYYGSTSVLSANAAVGASVIWQQYNGTLGYSFNNTNAALALTASKPVYIVCNPNTDGSANIDTSTPFTQDLPTTNDGKIYIYLGIASAATTVEMEVNHPVYYHNGTGIRLWTGG